MPKGVISLARTRHHVRARTWRPAIQPRLPRLSRLRFRAKRPVAFAGKRRRQTRSWKTWTRNQCHRHDGRQPAEAEADFALPARALLLDEVPGVQQAPDGEARRRAGAGRAPAVPRSAAIRSSSIVIGMFSMALAWPRMTRSRCATPPCRPRPCSAAQLARCQHQPEQDGHVEHGIEADDWRLRSDSSIWLQHIC